MIVFFSNLQNGRGETKLIGGIGEELGLQAEGMMRAVDRIALSVAPLGDKVGSVEMDPGERGFCFHGDTGGGGVGFCDCAESSHDTVYYIIVIIAAGIVQLIKILLNVGTDGSGRPEIHKSACDRFDGSVRDAFRIAGGVIPGKDLNALIQGRSGAMSCQIKIAVIGQVAEGILIRFGVVANDKAIVFQCK